MINWIVDGFFSGDEADDLLAAIDEQNGGFWYEEDYLEETAEEAFARMSPAEQQADMAYREQSRQQWHDDLNSQYERDAR